MSGKCDNARKIVDTRVATILGIIHSPLVASHLSFMSAHNQITSYMDTEVKRLVPRVDADILLFDRLFSIFSVFHILSRNIVMVA